MPAPAWTRGSWGAGSTLCQDQQPVQGAQEYASMEQPFPWITSKLPPYFYCFKYVLAACIRCPPFLGLGAIKLHFETNVKLWTFTSKFSCFQIPSPSRRLYVGSSRMEASSQLPSSSHTSPSSNNYPTCACQGSVHVLLVSSDCKGANAPPVIYKIAAFHSCSISFKQTSSLHKQI